MGEYKHRYGLNGTVVRQILDFMIFSSVYLSFAGVAMGYIACVVQGLPITWEVMAIMFLVTYAVYNIDRKSVV